MARAACVGCDAFLRYLADSFDAEFRRRAQASTRRGEVRSFFLYPESMRFCKRFELDSAGR